MPTIIKWGARAHLVGVGVVLGYGMSHGDLTAAYDHTAVTVLFNPFAIGFAIGLTGWAKCFIATPATSDANVNQNDGVDIDDENSDFLEDNGFDCDDGSFSGYDSTNYEVYGTLD